jgi:hypothetical protein
MKTTKKSSAYPHPQLQHYDAVLEKTITIHPEPGLTKREFIAAHLAPVFCKPKAYPANVWQFVKYQLKKMGFNLTVKWKIEGNVREEAICVITYTDTLLNQLGHDDN